LRLAPSGYGVDRLRQFDPQDVFCPGWQGRRPEVPRPPRQGVGPKGGRSGKPSGRAGLRPTPWARLHRWGYHRFAVGVVSFALLGHEKILARSFRALTAT